MSPLRPGECQRYIRQALAKARRAADMTEPYATLVRTGDTPADFREVLLERWGPFTVSEIESQAWSHVASSCSWQTADDAREAIRKALAEEDGSRKAGET